MQHERFGRQAEALAEAVALLEKHLGPEHTFTARCTQYLALALFEDGADLDEAARVSALALERLTAYYGAEHVEVATALALRARIEDAREDFAEDPNAPSTVKATRATSLAELYEALDEADLAADWRAVAAEAEGAGTEEAAGD